VNETLARLLEAQLEHELALWREDSVAKTVAELVHASFAWLGTVKLEEIVTPQQISAVIERYVIELRTSGGITELTGEMSRLVFHSRLTAETRVDEILAPASYEDFKEKLITLEGVRRKLIALVAQNTTFASINARMLARSLLDLITSRIPLGPAGLTRPLSELAERLGKTLTPHLEQRVTELLSGYVEERRDWVAGIIEQHLLSVLHPERVRAFLDELWDSVGPMHLAEAFGVMADHDLEDFVVLVLEFWQRYRKTPFFRQISSEMVEYFFRKYGAETAASLIEDMGVSELMVSEELSGFLLPVLVRAAQSGALEQLIRARLTVFYESPAALTALSG
jgi:hypothetical protein